MSEREGHDPGLGQLVENQPGDKVGNAPRARGPLSRGEGRRASACGGRCLSFLSMTPRTLFRPNGRNEGRGQRERQLLRSVLTALAGRIACGFAIWALCIPVGHADPAHFAGSAGPSWQLGFDSLSSGQPDDYEIRAGTGPLGAPGVSVSSELGWRQWWMVADLVVDGSLSHAGSTQAIGRWSPDVRDLTLCVGRSVSLTTVWLRLSSGAGIDWPRYYLSWQSPLSQARAAPSTEWVTVGRQAHPAFNHSLTLGLPIGHARASPGPAPGWAVVVSMHLRWTAAAWLGPGHTEQGLVPLSIGFDAGLRGQVALHRR